VLEALLQMLSLVAEIAGERKDFEPLVLDPSDDLLRIRLLVQEIIDRDIGALASISHSRSLPHAGIPQVLSALRPFGRPEPLQLFSP
jgi:hypothetical protein